MEERASFAKRRAHLGKMSDEELHEYFWQLTDKVVSPLLEAGKIYTTPAIERSVLLRMGFSSLEASPIVEGLIDRNLIGKGAGHVVWKLSEALGVSVREAGTALANGDHWDKVCGLFGEAK
jgi:D-ornithine 4,5-aminomutase subunit alpha